MGYDEVFNELQAGKAASGLPCGDVRRLLTQVGFTVRDGSKGGHKIVTHDHLDGFTTAAYNCKGGDGIVGRAYLGKLIQVLKTYKTGIKEYLGEDE